MTPDDELLVEQKQKVFHEILQTEVGAETFQPTYFSKNEGGKDTGGSRGLKNKEESVVELSDLRKRKEMRKDNWYKLAEIVRLVYRMMRRKIRMADDKEMKVKNCIIELVGEMVRVDQERVTIHNG